mmetsp:Transcript_120550/g.300740  ORF Transcript_120550/g.300740 Transcript_120550/m.300740 type:complete len:227 (+) Transcript_120550:41-721(+)
MLIRGLMKPCRVVGGRTTRQQLCRRPLCWRCRCHFPCGAESLELHPCRCGRAHLCRIASPWLPNLLFLLLLLLLPLLSRPLQGSPRRRRREHPGHSRSSPAAAPWPCLSAPACRRGRRRWPSSLWQSNHRPALGSWAASKSRRTTCSHSPSSPLTTHPLHKSRCGLSNHPWQRRTATHLPLSSARHPQAVVLLQPSSFLSPCGTRMLMAPPSSAPPNPSSRGQKRT